MGFTYFQHDAVSSKDYRTGKKMSTPLSAHVILWYFLRGAFNL